VINYRPELTKRLAVF